MTGPFDALGALREIEDDVERGWKVSRLLPKQSDHPGLRAHPASSLVSEVHADPATGRLRVVLSDAIAPLAGKTLLVAPTRDARDRWRWMCVPVEIAERYLPPECRHDFGLTRYRASALMTFGFNKRAIRQLIDTAARPERRAA